VPELPEVETVRQGLAKWVTGRTIRTVEVHHPRSIRRHLPGDAHFVALLRGRTVLDVSRRDEACREKGRFNGQGRRKSHQEVGSRTQRHHP
jgi:hypothetical protein